MFCVHIIVIPTHSLLCLKYYFLIGKISSEIHITKVDKRNVYIYIYIKDDGQSVDSNFSPVDNFDYVKQLRVLTVLNENFEIDLVPLYDEFMLSKNRIK